VTKKAAVKTPATQAPAVVHPKVTMLYLGQYVGLEGKVLYRWCTLPEDWRMYEDRVVVVDEGVLRVFSVKPSMARAGSVYTFEYPADKPSSIFTNSARYQGLFPNRSEVARLQVLDDAAKLDLECQRAEKRGKSRKVYLEILEPLRLAYWKMGPTERMVMVAKVVNAITGHRMLRATKEDT